MTREPHQPEDSPLRELVAERLDRHWQAWAEDHPHLAAAIDRTRLIDAAVDRLRDDPDYRAAMRRADLDERRLAEAARVLSLAERGIARLLPL
ncbi:MAG: hypothetical protein AAF800_09520 [Planctomycetota bacterium]